jgi:hypothetical protein
MLPICHCGDPCPLNEPNLIMRYIISAKNEVCVILDDAQLVATLRCRAPLWVCGDIFDCPDFGSRKNTSWPVLNTLLHKGTYLKNTTRLLETEDEL